jgi:hypothetical protein
MRTAALIAVVLGCLALSCGMECGLGTSGVGCATGGTGVPGCRTSADCTTSQFCDFVLEPCPTPDAGQIAGHRVKAGICRTLPEDSRGKGCSSSRECAPDEACFGTPPTCSFTGSCTMIIACPVGCVPTRQPHTYCDACLCDC